MTKARSQVLHSTIKKEEREDKPKLEQLLHNTSKARSKITKNRKPIQAQITKVESENVGDNKALLGSPKKKTFRASKITAEQITKLIGYIENDKMSIKEASKKAGISYQSAFSYYHEYQDDLEHKIPLPKKRSDKPPPRITQEQIDNLIRYLVNDGMSIYQASKKVDINNKTAAKYYAKYLEDPERKMPLLADRAGASTRRYTKEEIADLIGYIVRDKMPLVEASKKANMSHQTARKYYLKYLHNSNREIPDPHESDHLKGKHCTNDQISSLIGYIVNDGVSVSEASIKAQMSETSACKYYRQYLNDPENNNPTPKTNNVRASKIPLTVDQVKNFFCYIIVDKLNIVQAARKAKISRSRGSYYYTKYIENSIQETNIKDMSYSVEKMKQLVELVQNKKMSVQAAAGLVHLGARNAHQYYQQYLKNPQHGFPVIKNKQYTQEDIKMLIDCIERDQITVSSAAKRINMRETTARKYYRLYQNDPKHRIPVPVLRSSTQKNKASDKYAQIIADIYKNNPSIKPIDGSHDPELVGLHIEVKDESVEEDTKMLLKI